MQQATGNQTKGHLLSTGMDLLQFYYLLVSFYEPLLIHTIGQRAKSLYAYPLSIYPLSILPLSLFSAPLY